MRVAFDVGFTAEARLHGGPLFGIARAVEAWLSGLAGLPAIDLRLIGMCGDDPLFRSTVAAEYATKLDPARPALPGIVRAGTFVGGRVARAYAKHRLHLTPGLRATLVRHAVRPIKAVARRRTRLIDDADLLHCSFYPLPLGGEPVDVPRLLTVYDLIPITHPDECTPDQRNTARAIVDSIRPESDFAVCISEFVRSELIRLTPIPPDRVFAVPLGVGYEYRPIEGPEIRRRLSERYGVPTDKPFVLNLASYQPRKNLSGLIDAFVRWVTIRADPDLQLVLAGPRHPAHDRLLQATPDSMAARVHIAGVIDEADMPGLYSAATVFVFPSLAEGFGLPPLEAMACGTPVIASGLTSLPEVVGSAGMLFDPRDADALVNTLDRFFADASNRARLREQGLVRAEQFRWPVSVGRLADVYRQVVEQYRSFTPSKS